MIKKRLVPKGLLKRLGGKKTHKAAQTLEKKLRATLLEHAQTLSDEIRGVEAELLALPPQVSEQWLWLGDIKRAGYMMEQVIEMLIGRRDDEEATNESPKPA